MKRTAFTFWQAAALLAGVAGLAAILFPVFGRSREKRGSCFSSLKQIGLGIGMYSQDYDDVYPPVSAGGQGWSDLVLPYTGMISAGSRFWFHCPNTDSASDGKSTDYFYNSRLAGLSLAAVETSFPESPGSKEFVSATIMSGDGIANSRTDANLKEFSYGWRRNLDSPAFRHFGEYAIYLFADGHTRPLKPVQVSNDLPPKGSAIATFATG